MSFFAFTATPKDTTLEMFGEPMSDGSFHPFHIYSMHQAIEEGFILDVLQNYMTYKTCFKIAKNAPGNPEIPASSASKVIKKHEQLHPENIRQKSEIIVETFRSTTHMKISGKATMMVVTASRPAAVLYYQEVQRYQEKAQDEQYQIRRSMRNFCKWYKHVSQVVRMFNKELHREFVYCAFLVGLLPVQVVAMENIAELLTLEMYKLEKTFDSDISLGDECGTYGQAKDPLDKIIERINERYKGEFTEADRVVIGALANKLRSDTKLINMAISSDPKIFAESIFPQAFNIAAHDSYMESQGTYSSLFENQGKYNAIMSTLADMLYREMRKSGRKK